MESGNEPSTSGVSCHQDSAQGYPRSVLARLVAWVRRGALKELVIDMDLALDRARELSASYSEKGGARAIDLLHVACALLLESEVLLTCDQRQAALAKAEGLEVSFISISA